MWLDSGLILLNEPPGIFSHNFDANKTINNDDFMK